MPIYNENSREYVKLSSVFSNLTVELNGNDSDINDCLQAICKVCNKLNIRIKNPKGVLNDLFDNGFKIERNGEVISFPVDFEEDISSKKEKGGENMKKQYTPGITSGEKKIAVAVLDYYGDKINGKEKQIVLDSLKGCLPKIAKRAKSKLVLKVMIRGGYLIEKENKIYLGKEGIKYLGD